MSQTPRGWRMSTDMQKEKVYDAPMEGSTVPRGRREASEDVHLEGSSSPHGHPNGRMEGSTVPQHASEHGHLEGSTVGC